MLLGVVLAAKKQQRRQQQILFDLFSLSVFFLISSSIIIQFD